MQSPSYQQVALLHFSLIYFRFIFCFLELLAGFEPATAFALFSCFSICLFNPNLTLRKSALFPRTYPLCAGSPFYQQVALFHFSKNYFRFIFCFFGADGGTRTRDLCITSALLYQLSHISIWGSTPNISFYTVFYIFITLFNLNIKNLFRKVFQCIII